MLEFYLTMLNYVYKFQVLCYCYYYYRLWKNWHPISSKKKAIAVKGKKKKKKTPVTVIQYLCSNVSEFHYLQYIDSKMNSYTTTIIQSFSSHSFDDKYGECCLKTAVRLLGFICHHTTDPDRRDVPLNFLELVCLIVKSYDCTDSQVRVNCQSVGQATRLCPSIKALSRLEMSYLSYLSSI